ncbi:hypothetical protein D3H35_27475 [Cohnella faecalis]|uniref:Uncharacterized protein n=1 Tax=Cohnella faecalis TaxID=2315694 RepID=A0A398CD17_9BACL|nr:hypothetical protein D3H35_27475 [Cohnella faecalis]
MHWTVPSSKGTTARLGLSFAIERSLDNIRRSSAGSSRRFTSNMRNPPPFAPPVTAAGLYLMKVNAARPSRRAS